VLLKNAKIQSSTRADFGETMKGKIVHLSGRMEYPFVAGIALALYDEHGSISFGKGAEVIEPVGKRSVTERESVFLVGNLAL
jgi:hypothetical protein